MQINETKRPWIKNQKHGNRYNRDPFYNTKEWSSTRSGFLSCDPWVKLPPIMGIPYANKFCVECWKRGKIVDTDVVDHVQRIRDGGSKTEYTNLQGLCHPDHNAKSAREKNELNDKKV